MDTACFLDPPRPLPHSSVAATDRSYTGQYLDDTGLLFYNARYYDAGIGRFISADSMVPGNASGGMAGVAYKPLTVDFHEPGFVSVIAGENQFGPWYTLSDKQRQQLGSLWGPANPQALNRYAYVGNNPVRWVDPSGHDSCTSGPGCGGVVYNNTGHDIYVVGSVKGNCGADGLCDNVKVRIPPGKSSADMGVYDADAVVLQDYGNGTYLGYKITNYEYLIVDTLSTAAGIFGGRIGPRQPRYGEEKDPLLHYIKWYGAIYKRFGPKELFLDGEKRMQVRSYDYVRRGNIIYPVGKRREGGEQ